MKKTNLLITLIVLFFCSCSSVICLAKNDEKADIQISSPTKTAFFVAKENVASGANLEKHTDTANRLYNNYGPAVEDFLIGRTNAQTFIFSDGTKSWYVDVNKLKKPFAMIVFDGYHKPKIEYNVSKYESKIKKYINPRPKTINKEDNNGIETFSLQSELTNNSRGFLDNNRFDRYSFEIFFHVNLVGIDKSARTNSYEVESDDIAVNLSGEIKESEDFTRRLMYRYDWIQPKVNFEGQVVSIENKQELKETWIEMKNSIQEFYGGTIVKNGLEKIDSEFDTDQPVYASLSQYFFFGLLFPDIPVTHAIPWERKRIIGLSPYDDEQFEEQAVYVKTSNGKRRYNIKGSLLPGSQAELETFEGYMIVPENQILPTKIEVNTSYKRGKIIIQWHFILERR